MSNWLTKLDSFTQVETKKNNSKLKPALIRLNDPVSHPK